MQTILVIDDERNVHYSFQRALGGTFQIISAFSGEEALQKLAAEKPHLILLEVKLSGLGGLETLQHIKALDRELPQRHPPAPPSAACPAGGYPPPGQLFSDALWP